MNKSELAKRFSYHPPHPVLVNVFLKIREEAKSLAFTLNANCPESRELSLAMTKLEEAVMWANAAIARHQDEACLLERNITEKNA